MTRGFSFADFSRTVPAGAVKFDYYSATLGESVAARDVLQALTSLGLPSFQDGRYGYEHRVDFMAGKQRVAQLSYGGRQPRPLVVASGGGSPEVAALLRERWADHRVTRVDAAIDWDDVRAWSVLTEAGLAVARSKGIKTRVAGDWIDGVAGRTLYMGGQTARSQARIYEKGKQLPEAERPHWVRAEVQWRPDKAQRSAAASVGPAECWGGSAWTVDLLKALGGLGVAPVDGLRWVPPDDLRARKALLRQYGGILEAWAVECGGWDVLGDLLETEVRQAKAVEASGV